jgi:hypothetical protein
MIDLDQGEDLPFVFGLLGAALGKHLALHNAFLWGFVTMQRCANTTTDRSRYRRMRHSAVLCICIVLGLTSAVQAGSCTQERLNTFIGSWTARGAAQINPDATREPIRCQVSFTATSRGRIEATGRCATSTETGDIGGWLECDGDAFSGQFFAFSGEGPPTFIRDISNRESIILVLEGLDPTSGEIERYRLNIESQTPTSMVLRVTRGAWTAMTLRYSRQSG